MGEIADAFLSGLFDEETGELIDGESPGYPRRMSDNSVDQNYFSFRGNRHQRKLKSKKPFACSACRRRFFKKTSLKQHLDNPNKNCPAKPEPELEPDACKSSGFDVVW